MSFPVSLNYVNVFFSLESVKKVHLKIYRYCTKHFSPLLSCPDFNSVFVFLLLFQLEVCRSPDGRGLLSVCTLIRTHRDCHSTHTLGHNSFTHRMLCLSRAGHTALALAASASGSILRNGLASIKVKYPGKGNHSPTFASGRNLPSWGRKISLALCAIAQEKLPKLQCMKRSQFSTLWESEDRAACRLKLTFIIVIKQSNFRKKPYFTLIKSTAMLKYIKQKFE